ncbi:hypothetical protein QZH41_015759, partial [Actinostola sp. cb2023]
ALATYFKTLKDSKRRKQKKGAVDHKTTCRRQGRLREKIARRDWAVDHVGFSEREKRSVKSVLCRAFTSSDESETEDMEDGSRKKRFFCKEVRLGE